MLTLNVFKDNQERLCLLGLQIRLLQAGDQSALLRNLPGTVLDVPPDHPEFGFTIAH